MASGFIILRDGRCLSVRDKIHDAVVHSIAAVLDVATPFHDWLAGQAPREGDVELGYGFVRQKDGSHVTRELDIRGLTAGNRTLFERAARDAKPIAGPYAPAEDVDRVLQRLRRMLDSCEEGRPVLELSDLRVEAPPCETRIGPGWAASD